MAGWCRDDDLVWSIVEAIVDDVDVPAGHLAGVVAPCARTAAIGVASWSSLSVAGAVVDVSDWRIAVGAATDLVSKFDELGESAVEMPAGRVATDDHLQAARRLGRLLVVFPVQGGLSALEPPVDLVGVRVSPLAHPVLETR